MQHHIGKQRYWLRKVTAHRRSGNCLPSLKCLLVHSLSHTAAGIQKQNTLRWLEAAQTVFGGSAGHTPWPTPSSKPLPREDILAILVYFVLSASNPEVSFPKLQQGDASEIGFAGTELFPSLILGQ